MKLQTLIENLPILIKSKEGVQGLRDLIRYFAVTGVLTQTKKEADIDDVNGRSQVELPDDWRWVRIEEVSDFVNGFAFRSDEYKPTGIGVVRMSDLKFGQVVPDHMKFVSLGKFNSLDPSFRIEPGSIVMGMTGATLGKPCINRTSETYLLNQRIGKFIPKKIDPSYFLIALAYLEKSFMKLSFGTGVNNLSTKQIKDSLIPLPPDAVQLEIVRLVTHLFAICDELEIAQVNQEAMSKQARASCLDGISKANSRRDLEIAWNRIEGNWKLFSDSTESVEQIRLLIHDLALQGVFGGEGTYEEIKLKELAQINYGYTESAQLQEVGPKFLRITDIQLGKVDWDRVPYCQISKIDEAKHLLVDGDLVFARTGATTGKSFLLKDPPKSVCASYLIRVRPNKMKVISDYLYLYFQSGNYWSDVKSGMTGTAQGGFNSSKLGNLTIKLPSLDSQIHIVRKVSELLQICDSLQNALRFRDEISQKLVNSVTSSL